jgi:hypothetical protein
MKKLNAQRTKLLKSAYNRFGKTASFVQLKNLAIEMGYPYPRWLIASKNRIGHGLYDLESPVMQAQILPISKPVKSKKISSTKKSAVKQNMNMESESFQENLVPTIDPLFTPFGNFNLVKDVVKSKMFYPLYITGLSGNGKTLSVEQACASTKREVIRINFTVETDEDDLIGGFRLVDGETKFFKGPVIKAMELGAVLLCDEIDLANPAKVMCLQSILEGGGYFIKKTGEYVTPASGFTVVATANTKGKGSDDGRFIGTNVMNEAFLERFPITVEQQYPTPAIEKKILGNMFADLKVNDDEFVEKLVDWADIIRKTFYDGGVDEIISTRRLVHIAKAYSIFGDRMKAIQMCINRFDDDTKVSFADLYSKIDVGVQIEESSEEVSSEPEQKLD